MKFSVLLASFMFTFLCTEAQMVTGVWHGKMGGQNTEVKIIRNGDSIAGTSYYYSSAKSYRRYSIKGYFDEGANQVVWWDDRLLEEKSGGLFGAPGKVPLAARADFNCPGSGVMKLDGSSTEKDKEGGGAQVHLQKISNGPAFTDEWDDVIDNYTTGTNDPYLIDSISRLPSTKAMVTAIPKAAPKTPETMAKLPEPERKKTVLPQPEQAVVAIPKTIEQKFTSRTKKVFTTIPVEGDSISLSFYDNAIVDGDSISLFLDGRMLFTNVRLTEKPYTVKLALKELNDNSELTMVAENLGSIPPNTSYMVAVVGGKRYTANLASTEESSAVIQLKRK